MLENNGVMLSVLEHRFLSLVCFLQQFQHSAMKFMSAKKSWCFYLTYHPLNQLFIVKSLIYVCALNDLLYAGLTSKR